MGFYEDHLNAVSLRWAQKYRESGLSKDKFIESAKKTLLEYGWSDSEVDKMISIVIEKGSH